MVDRRSYKGSILLWAQFEMAGILDSLDRRPPSVLYTQYLILSTFSPIDPGILIRSPKFLLEIWLSGLTAVLV